MKRSRSRPERKQAVAPAAAQLTGRKQTHVWLFRLSVALAPLLLLLLIEGLLRLIGFGYPTDFFLPARIKGEAVYVQNDRFGWRFFGPERARQPAPMVIAKNKPPDTVRIFVFGESAAYGDPQLEFGIARVIEALLTQRFPATKFQVFNVAMTAINSHVILPIARECARHEGDIWVLYMGNNEVVGPYGPGTVFSRNAPGLTWIRCALALKTTRIAQGLERLIAEFRSTPVQNQEWGGMQMFLDYQVRSTDPALSAVYSNFEQNLQDIVKTGRKHGVKLVISTVASNLRDCAPFASLHRPDLADAELARWKQFYGEGVSHQEHGESGPAVDAFRQAGAIDDGFADLHFREGQCALALGHREDAVREFRRARDEDALRFRCDSRLNEILAKAGSGRAADSILFTDSVSVAAQAGTDGVPDRESFYEHVHLTFEGNYRLGLALAQQVAKLLPDKVAHKVAADQPWPGIDDCARRLGWSDWTRLEGTMQMLDRLEDPPFTGQLNWTEEVKRLREQVDQLRSATKPDGLRMAAARIREALVPKPNDWQLLRNLARLQEALGDTSGAASSWHTITEQLPFEPEIWEGYGNALAQAGKETEAMSAFQEALRLNPESMSSRTALGQLLFAQRKYAEAAREFEGVLNLKPYWGPAQLGLGKALEALGRGAEAQTHYRKALQNRIRTPGSFKALGQFCFEKKWYSEAATNFADALSLDPSDAATQVNLGLTLALLGRPADARGHYAEAVRLDPNLAEARMRLGTALGQAGNDAAALEQFAAAVRLKPDLLEARLDLGIALTKQHRNEEALAQFQEVLKRYPGNPVALRYAQALRAPNAGGP